MLSRFDGLDRLADVRNEHLQILQTMHAVGMKWAEKFLHEDASLAFRLGYHSVQNTTYFYFYFVVFLFLSVEESHTTRTFTWSGAKLE